jgi:hypothetical protein
MRIVSVISIIALFIAPLRLAGHQNLNNHKNTMIENPYYTVKFNAVSCSFDIRVNDVSVFSLNVNGQVGTSVPANHGILESGRQKISFHISPVTGEEALRDDASFRASVGLYEVGGNKFEEVEEEIISFTMPEMATDTPLTEYNSEILFFDATVPYKLDLWQNSQDLRKVDNLNALVDAASKKIEEYISTKQYDKFNEMMAEKEDYIGACMYLTSDEKENRMQEFIDDLENGFEWVPFSMDDVVIAYYADGKLIKLLLKNGRSAFSFFNKETEETMQLLFNFHLKQGETELSVI